MVVVAGLTCALPWTIASAQVRAPAPVTRAARATETARIGEGERIEHSFSRITGLALDAAGNLYVADAQEQRIAVFAPDGTRLALFGRVGKGPGEFDHPTQIAIDSAGVLWVSDVVRVQRFRAASTGAPATTYAAVVGTVTFHDWTSTRAGVIDRAGHFHVPVSYTRTAGPDAGPVAMIKRLARDGRIVDSVLVPRYPNAPSSSARYSVDARSGRMLRGLNHVPFAGVPVWTSSPVGTIISGNGLKYELVETDGAGTVVRRFNRTDAAVPIDAAERRDSLRALTVRFDSIPVPLTQVQGMPEEVRQKRLPTHYPPYRELSVSREGALWVRRWTTPAERGTSRYDVFAPDARFLGTVSLPAELIGEPTLMIAGRRAAGIVTDRETGLQTVVRFDVPDWVAGESTSPRRP